MNPSLLALFERPLQPMLLLGLTIREAVALEASFRAHSESLSHSMWLLFGLLAFVRLQGFQPADSPLFNTFITALSRSLAHHASVAASHTTFMGLKRRQFYLSHLPAYFSEVNKRAMLSSPLVCSDLLFAESDIARMVADTRASSSLHSQQALVDVASRSSGPRGRRFSPSRSPARISPSRRHPRESGSPLANPSVSALTRPLRLRLSKGHVWVFADGGHIPVRQVRGVSSGTLGGLGVVGLRSLGGAGSPLRVSSPVSFTAPALFCSTPSAELQPQFRPWAGSCRCSRGSAGGGGNRACASFPGLLQPSLCDSQGHWWVASGD